MNKKLFTLAQQGQTLIEVLAAFGIAVFIVSAITVTVIFALSTTRSGKNKNLATQYAQEGMEAARRLQEAGQLTGVEGPRCLNIGRKVLTNKQGLQPCQVAESPFSREIEIKTPDQSSCGGGKQIKVTVKWSDNTCPQGNLFCNETEISSCLSQANVVATPGPVN